MAPVSGSELLVRMRHLPRNRDTPFLMMTGRGQKRFAAVGRDGGATRYLERPFTAAALLERIGEALVSPASSREAAPVEQRALRRR